VALAATAVVGCGFGSGGWKSPYLRDHPLVGRIQAVKSGEWIDESRLVEALAKQSFVVLGEKHDNADHHRLQARVIGSLVRAGRRPAIALEMLSADVTADLAKATSLEGVTAEEVRAAVRWDASAWPPFALYSPVFEAALSARLPLATANLPRAALERLARSGLAGLDARTRDELTLGLPLGDAERAAMAADLREAHCGHADPASLDRMVDSQTARDAWMAAALLAVASYPGTDGAVLIAGNEHARRDRGAPIYLRRRDPEATVASLAFVEVREGATDPRAALGLEPGAPAPFDYVWFTPASDDEDPCERFRPSLERMRKPAEPVVD
jgi:uncharacterized iron-regulated protein